MTSMSTTVTTGLATFTSKANLADISNAAIPIALGGNLDLQMTLQDNAGSGDTLGITLRSSNGALLFSSSWNGSQTMPQNLSGGNLVVR